ncbi:uncharacterized protein LOC131158950 [Malania oleifera]|uniref:uncharacterized protein LOC131158950 n=1 Tax=Malania oleifera TaxID=397392 RepID=UPI0025AE5DAC|nr:uncharacterized protein LOC131158950 [Malania oleifera]
MAEIRRSSQQSHQPNPVPQTLFAALDPVSLLRSQNSNSDGPPNFLKLTTESFIMERGPRYNAYAELRESKLRERNMNQEQDSKSNSDLLISRITPPKKQVKFQGTGRKGPSALTQSVPDFSYALRKENRRPANPVPTMVEMTPPAKRCSPVKGVPPKQGGCKSASGGEKRGGGLMARKSYASVEELRGLSSAAATAINGENRGGRSGTGAGIGTGTGRGVGKNILGYRQF